MSDSADIARFRLGYELGCAFATRIELDELIPFVVAKCREVLDAEGVSVLLLDPERNEFYFPYGSEADPEVGRRLAALRFPADRGIAGAVLRSRRSERVDDTQIDLRFYREVDRKTGLTTRSLIAAPLNWQDQCLGVIEAVNHRGGAPFAAEHLQLLETLAGSIAVAIRNARRFGQVRDAQEQLRAQLGALRRDLARRDLYAEIVGSSPAMAEVFGLMESAAASPIAVLIEGETGTGTGKELVARAIHRTSARADGPFIAVNCAAFAETLLESELFGHRRGAFTGATHDEPGLFRAASGGVIFLDEIGEMPPAMQAKLLRVLQEGEVVAVGDTRTQKVDVRVISATNRELEGALADHSFREDLYYRLAAFPIRMPPLRERREDIALLAARLLAAAAERNAKHLGGFEPAALDLLRAFDWPGNVRQLQNESERAVALARDGETIGPAHLSAPIRAAVAPLPDAGASSPTDPVASRAPAPAAAPLREARAAFEANYITQALRRHDGNVSHTARALGFSRVALQKKMKDYGLR